MQKIYKFIFTKILGWHFEGNFPANIKKCIVVVAPHTSFSDFYIGKLGYLSLGIKTYFLIKKELFFFPLNIIIKALGGLPVDRSKNNDMVNQIIDMFNKNDNLILTITPEGTRKKVHNWKRGFYYIAQKANVPVILGSLDYKKKTAKLLGFFDLTDNVEKDMKRLQAMYIGVTAKYPENFSTGTD